MSKLTFTYEERSSLISNCKSKISFEIDGHTSLSELLDKIQSFLVASGYYFNRGDRLRIANEDDGFNGTREEDFINSSFDDFDNFQPNYSSAKYNFTDEQIANEVARLRESDPLLSEEAYEMTAWKNLCDRLDKENENAR